MRDARPWITVADTFPENTKTVQLSDGAFRAVVTFWCYANRNKTDGFLHQNAAKSMAKLSHIRELIKVGFLEDLDPETGGYKLHDYLKHQRSRDEIDSQAETRKKANSKGGTLGMHNRWHKERGLVDPRCEHCTAEPQSIARG